MTNKSALPLIAKTDAHRVNLLFAQIRVRLWCQRLIDSITMGLLFSEICGILLFIVCFLCGRFDMSVPLYFAMTMGIGVLGGLTAALFAEKEKYEAEKRTDEFYSFENRFLTMAELLSTQDQRERNAIEILQIEDCMAHLPCIQPHDVAPLKCPQTLASVICLLFLMAAVPFILIQTSPSAEAKTQNQTVAEIIIELEENIRNPLKTMIRDHPERETLKELDRQVVQLQKSLEECSDSPEKSLAVLSRMEQEIQKAVDSFHIEAADQSLKEIGSALLNDQTTQKAATAILEDDYETAAAELEKIDFDSMKRQEREMLAQKLKKAAETIRQRKQNQLAQLADQLANELQEAKCASCKNTACKLAGKCNAQKSNKELAQKLNCQLARLGLCKANCAGACASCQNNCSGKKSPDGAAMKGHSSGSLPGSDVASDPLTGRDNDLNSTRQQHQLSGIQSDEGASVKEVLHSTQHKKEKIKTVSEETYNTYKKQMEAVLDSNDIPMEQRPVIRQYFESIRPQKVSGEATTSAGQSTKN